MDNHFVLQTVRTPQPVPRQAMVRAQRYHERYPDVFERYISHFLPFVKLQPAYEIASKAAPDRLKVILDARA